MGSADSGRDGEQYCLRWNDFQANVTGALSDIRDGEEFLDVTLVSEGKEVRAHKLILSSCSPLFRQMLKKNTHPQPMIFLHGIRFADLSSILNFMYHGEVNVGQDELSRFLAAAEELRIRGLSEKTPEQMAAVKSKLQQPPSSSSSPSSSSKKAASAESNKESSPPAAHRRLPQEYSNDDSPVAKRMRQSEGETGPGDHGGGAEAEDEEGYPEDGGEGGEEDGEGGYYNHVDMEGYAVEEGEVTPAQGGDPLLWYQQQQQQQQQHSHLPEQYYAQQQQMAAAHRLTKKLTSQQQLLWQQQLQADPSMQHADPSMQRVICPHCNKELKNTHSLTVHVSRYHREGGESISEVACPVCKRMYSNKYSLRTHMHLNHKDQLHLIGSGKKNKKGSTSAAAATSSDNIKIAAKVEQEHFYAV